MRKILIKESEIRNYVRSLIRESMEMEGHASPKTIQKWLNATPEEIATWKPEGNQDPGEFADLQRMAMRQPYNRTHFMQASRDIEDAWRKHNNLQSLKTITDANGKRLRKIDSVDADGNPIFSSKTAEQARADHNRVSSIGQKNKRAENSAIRKAEKEAQKAENDRIEQEQRAAEEQENMTKWCQENNIDPSSPEAEQLYLDHVAKENKRWYYEHGMDEFSAEALRRRIAWLKNKMEQTQYSSDTFDQKVFNSCAYVLKDTERMLRQNFGNDGRRLVKKENDVDDDLSSEEINTIGQEGKKAAEEDIYGKDSEFIAWCNQFNCPADEQTKEIFNTYKAQFNKWCSDAGRDISDPSTKEVFDEFYSDYVKQQLNDINANYTQSKSNNKNDDDYEEEEVDDNDQMYDDDGLSGRAMRRYLGDLDPIYDDDDDEHFNRGEEDEYSYSNWN